MSVEKRTLKALERIADVLEQMANPPLMIAEFPPEIDPSKLLPGGVTYVETPNLMSWGGRRKQ